MSGQGRTERISFEGQSSRRILRSRRGPMMPRWGDAGDGVRALDSGVQAPG